MMTATEVDGRALFGGASCSTGRVPKPRRDARGVKDDPKRRPRRRGEWGPRRRGTTNQRPRRYVPRFLCKIGVSIFLGPPRSTATASRKTEAPGTVGRQRRRVGGGCGGGGGAVRAVLIDATTSMVSHEHPRFADEIKLTSSTDPVYSIPIQP
ncbi:hypothetical protein DFP72DRAFT_907143 [Ephemerocybe angulata]|uniref:Uncharacterized protein n=1 Tax=Ephemerocybe angulata TaxID=980116 RepID=A0A8H6HQS1_9AGAR|nr:hypothetical protein DFP72DRAFT_907143 [Tulosesus angulatus]